MDREWKRKGIPTDHNQPMMGQALYAYDRIRVLILHSPRGVLPICSNMPKLMQLVSDEAGI